MTFVNFSNHRSSAWSEKQLMAAREYGDIVDYPFPQVMAEANEEQIEILAEEAMKGILELNPSAVMCAGEFTLAFRVAQKLLDAGVTCLSACSDRVTKEETLEDGTTRKVAMFDFVRFREYR